MNMKKLIFIFAALMALGACQEKNQSTTAMPSDADSIYTYQYIKMHFVKWIRVQHGYAKPQAGQTLHAAGAGPRRN